jgi:integrase
MNQVKTSTPPITFNDVIARTLSGITVKLAGDCWTYRDGLHSINVNFRYVKYILSGEMMRAYRTVLIWYIENSSTTHLKNMHERFVHLIKFLAVGATEIEEITDVDILNYKASLTSNIDWYLTNLAGIFRRWKKLGLSHVNSAVLVLDDLRLGGNKKGAAVLTMDVFSGPFSDTELQAIQASLDDAFAIGEIEEDAYLLGWLFMTLGQRPVQYAALKVCDVITQSLNDGNKAYILRVPRAKQRHQSPRTTFKERPLISQIGAPLSLYARKIQAYFQEILSDPSQAPLFPQKRAARIAPGFDFHRTAGSLGVILAQTLSKLNVVSERTGEQLHITPTRFRRTFGTRAAQEGHGELVIAELLDHSDTQNVGVYVGCVPEIAARIDRAVAIELAPLAQAFKGVLIKNESQASRAGDPSSRIRDLRIDRGGMPMGSCGTQSFCNFAAPVACYTCSYFEPWLDGPHEMVLNQLLEKRDELIRTSDMRMASVNDRTIFAVAQVIRLCRKTLGVDENE